MSALDGLTGGLSWPFWVAEILNAPDGQGDNEHEGPAGLISRHCNRPSNNRLDTQLERQIVSILRESYTDFGPTLAAEKLPPPGCPVSSRPTTPGSPRESYDAHRTVRADENLDLIFAWRELRKVTQSLTLHYERQLYLLADTADNRRLIGKYVEVFQYPDGRIEIRVVGQSVPYSRYDSVTTLRRRIYLQSPHYKLQGRRRCRI